MLHEVVVPTDWEERATPFTASALVDEGWPKPSDRYLDNFEESARDAFGAVQLALKALFAIVYSKTIPEEALHLYKDNSDYKPLVDCLSLIGAYAAYFGCLPLVAGTLHRSLEAYPRLWEAVADGPLPFLQLGEKLRCPEVYVDALRHLVVKDERQIRSGEAWGGSLDYSDPEIAIRLVRFLDDRNEVLERLKEDLSKLGLTKLNTSYGGELNVAHTTFFNALKFKKKDRSEFAKHRERCDYMARGIYLQ
jgi:hypothetical protein